MLHSPQHPFMLVFVLRRLAQAVIVMLTVAFIAFMLFQYVGDPVTNILGQDATPEQRQQLRADLGLDQPFPVQFVRFVGKAVQGEFGLSLRQGRKVSSLIAERLPATLELSFTAAFIALVFGIPMGVYAALRRGSFASQVMMTVSLLGVSLPTFLIGILLILVFAVTLKWLPSFGRGDVTMIGAWSDRVGSIRILVVREALGAGDVRGAERCCRGKRFRSSAAVTSANSVAARRDRRASRDVPCALPSSGGDLAVSCFGAIDSCGSGVGDELTIRIFSVGNYYTNARYFPC